jgi:hypothetical protein
MKHSNKVILIVLGLWLGISTLVGIVGIATGEGYAVLLGLIVALYLGIAIVIVCLILGAVILLGKLDGGMIKTSGEDLPLDAPKTEVLGYKKRAMPYFLAAALVVLIGGSVCGMMLV